MLIRTVVILIFLFFCFSLYAEAPSLQRGYVGQITIERTSFQVNEEFRFTIFIPEISPLELVMEEPQFPSGVEITRGPSIRPGINGTIIDYSFILNRAGRYLIDSFTIKHRNRIMHTTPVFITAVPIPQRHYPSDAWGYRVSKPPPSVRWAIPNYSYFPGEIIPLRFVVENVENPNIVIESRVSQTIGGYVKRGSRTAQENEKTIITKRVARGEIYDVFFHDHIFVPFRYGSITLPNVEIYISEGTSEHRVTLKGVPVAISTPPKAEKNTGALGNFFYEYEISSNTISAFQAVILTQRITGTGNFFGITMPAPYISDPEIADITLIRDIFDVVPAGNPVGSPGYRFFKGSRELTYSIIKKRDVVYRDTTYPKNILIMIPDFSWHDPLPGLTLRESSGIALALNFEEDSLAQPVSDLAQADREKKARKILLDIFKIILIISIAPALFFVLKKKIKKSIIAILIIVVISVIIGFLVITRVLATQPVYGIIGSGAINVYVIPEEEASVRFILEDGEAVRIIGEKGQFYLIESVGKGSRGWAKKENIILE